MYVPSNSPKYICYRCRNKIPVEDLDAVFQEQLRDFFFSPEEITKYLAGADETMRSKEETIGVLAKEAEKLRADMEKLSRLYLADEITKEGLGRHYRPLEERLGQIENELPALQGELDFLKIRLLSSDEVFAEARDLYSRWPSLTPEEKRQVVENITEEIIVGTGEIDIKLCYLPSPTPPPCPSGSQKLLAKGQRNFTGSSRRRAGTRPGRRPCRCHAPP